MPVDCIQCRTDVNLWLVVARPTTVFSKKLPVNMRANITCFVGKVLLGLLLTYVGDLLSSSKAPINSIIMSKVKRLWACGDVISTADADALVFLSTRISKVWYQSVFGYRLDQFAYLEDLLDRNHMTDSNPVKTSLTADIGAEGPSWTPIEDRVELLMSPEVKEAQRMGGSSCGCRSGHALTLLIQCRWHVNL